MKRDKQKIKINVPTDTMRNQDLAQEVDKKKDIMKIEIIIEIRRDKETFEREKGMFEREKGIGKEKEIIIGNETIIVRGILIEKGTGKDQETEIVIITEKRREDQKIEKRRKRKNKRNSADNISP